VAPKPCFRCGDSLDAPTLDWLRMSVTCGCGVEYDVQLVETSCEEHWYDIMFCSNGWRFEDTGLPYLFIYYRDDYVCATYETRVSLP